MDNVTLTRLQFKRLLALATVAVATNTTQNGDLRQRLMTELRDLANQKDNANV